MTLTTQPAKSGSLIPVLGDPNARADLCRALDRTGGADTAMRQEAFDPYSLRFQTVCSTSRPSR